MHVEIVSYTPHPVDVCSIAAGTSYGMDDPSIKRLRRCVQQGHNSVLEHASVTFRVDGISRACSHQLVRHRLASFVQKSQRYTKVTGDDWYVIPPSFDFELEDAFCNAMSDCMQNYQAALDAGVRPEDARYLLPEACKTEITVTMNYRSLYHFLDLRLDEHAQWEIRQLAESMFKACATCEDTQVADMLTYYRLHHSIEA